MKPATARYVKRLQAYRATLRLNLMEQETVKGIAEDAGRLRDRDGAAAMMARITAEIEITTRKIQMAHQAA